MQKSFVIPSMAALILGLGVAACTKTADTDMTDTDTDMNDTDVDACANLCATYGAAVPQVASDITDAAATSAQFGDDFAPLVARGDEAVANFKTSLGNFISDAYGCSTDKYTGPTMQAAHAGMGITQSDYDDFVTLIAGVLTHDGVTEADVNNCFAPVLTDPTFSATIVGQ
jgi:hypothetical protein